MIDDRRELYIDQQSVGRVQFEHGRWLWNRTDATIYAFAPGATFLSVLTYIGNMYHVPIWEITRCKEVKVTPTRRSVDHDTPTNFERTSFIDS